MDPPRIRSTGPGGPGTGGGEQGERSSMMKASREGRECRRGRGERGESPQLKVESVGEGECGGTRVPPGPGGMLRDEECGCDNRSR